MDRQNRLASKVGFLSSTVVLSSICVALTGCNQYFDRQDPITLGAGNAIAQNKVTQAITPWPPGSENPKHTTNGARSLIATRRYEKNQSIEPQSIRTHKVK